MKRKFCVPMGAFLLTIGIAVSGHTSTIMYEDLYDDDITLSAAAAGTELIERENYLTWTFDITDTGFDPDSFYEITDAWVFLWFNQDSEQGQEPNGSDEEYASLVIGLDSFAVWEVDNGKSDKFTMTSLISLNDYGTVDVTLTATDGSFNFNKAKLKAEAAPVPEPATMLLFGTGIAGLAGSRFRRKKK
jgi:hypothetical protein